MRSVVQCNRATSAMVAASRWEQASTHCTGPMCFTATAFRACAARNPSVQSNSRTWMESPGINRVNRRNFLVAGKLEILSNQAQSNGWRGKVHQRDQAKGRGPLSAAPLFAVGSAPPGVVVPLPVRPPHCDTPRLLTPLRQLRGDEQHRTLCARLCGALRLWLVHA